MDARRHRLLALLLCLAMVLLAPAAQAQPVPASDVDPAAVDAFLKAQMDKHNLPGLSVVIIEHGRITYRQGYGDAGHGRAMTPDTPQPIGSITKTITATVVLSLVEDGALRLDEPVRTYLPEFTVADPTASTTITVRQLLQHTSGLSDSGYNRVLSPEVTLAEAVRDLRHAEVTSAPGTAYNYFNPNYSVLGLLIEKVTGSKYADVVAQRVFKPLSMTRSTADYASVTETMAQGHTKLFGFAVPVDSPFKRSGVGYGYVVSTASDLARFAVGVGLPDVDAAHPLSTATLTEMHQPSGVPDSSYGLGWDSATGGHDGLLPSYMGQMSVQPDRQSGYVLLMNEGHLIDVMIAFPQLREGMLALLQGRSAQSSGVGVQLVGIVLLVVLLISVYFAVRSALRLRGWPERSRAMTTGQIVRAVAPHVLVPVAVLLLLYYGSPMLMGGRAFNVRDIGIYYMPDVLILLALAVVPDLLQAAWMVVTAALARRKGQATPQLEPEPDSAVPTAE